MVAVRTKNLEAEKRALTIQTESEYARLEQEREVAVRRAQQRSEGGAREGRAGTRDRRGPDPRHREIERARIAQERLIEAERIEREKEIERLEILRQKARQLEEKDSVIAIAEKSKAQSEAQAAAEEARGRRWWLPRSGCTHPRHRDRRAPQADRDHRAQQDARARDGQVPRQGRRRKKRRPIDRAEADRTEVAALQVRISRSRRKSKRKLNEAENLRSDASRRSAHQLLVDRLPEIIRESVRPMEKIDSIKILQVDGLPGLSGTQGGSTGQPAAAGDGTAGRRWGRGPEVGYLAERASSTPHCAIAQAPFVDNLLNEIGMSAHSINIEGLSTSPRPSTTPPVAANAPKPIEKK